MDVETILLVDDEDLVLSSYGRVLRKQFNLEVAHGGLEALEKIKASSFPVVVSDMRMPGMNGIELL
ncbi:MAG: two-component system response regulator, partial [Acidobacteria bacterium]